jgi:predicted GIY-YIG superfamily endonuclease
MKIKKETYVYCLKDENDVMFYIGVSCDTKRRLAEHNAAWVLKKKKLYSKMAKAGIKSFTMEILYTYDNEYSAKLKECALICEHKLEVGSKNLNSVIWADSYYHTKK